MGAMGEPIEGTVGQDGIVEEGHPFLDRAVAGDHSRGMTVAFDQDIVQVAGLLRPQPFSRVSSEGCSSHCLFALKPVTTGASGDTPVFMRVVTALALSKSLDARSGDTPLFMRVVTVVTACHRIGPERLDSMGPTSSSPASPGPPYRA